MRRCHAPRLTVCLTVRTLRWLECARARHRQTIGRGGADPPSTSCRIVLVDNSYQPDRLWDHASTGSGHGAPAAGTPSRVNGAWPGWRKSRWVAIAAILCPGAIRYAIRYAMHFTRDRMKDGCRCAGCSWGIWTRRFGKTPGRMTLSTTLLYPPFIHQDRGVNRARRVIHRHHEIKRANSGQPGVFRTIVMQHHTHHRTARPLAPVRAALRGPLDQSTDL